MFCVLNKKVVCAAVWGLAIATSGIAEDNSSLGDRIKDSAENAAISVTKGAFDAIDKKDLSITFERGTKTLTKGQMIELSALVKSLDKNPKRLKLTVAGWADADYPSNPVEKLSSGAELLAEQRMAAVTKYIHGLAKFSKTETVNMAKRANAFERFFASDETQVKAAITGAEAKEPWIAYEANTLRSKGGAGKAVVIIYDMSENFSH
jgi:hypothetical protein